MENREQAIQDAMRIAQSQSGKQLLNRLKQNNGDALNQAMQYASSGNYAMAQKLIQSMLDDPETRKMIQNLGGKNG